MANQIAVRRSSRWDVARKRTFGPAQLAIAVVNLARPNLLSLAVMHTRFAAQLVLLKSKEDKDRRLLLELRQAIRSRSNRRSSRRGHGYNRRVSGVRSCGRRSHLWLVAMAIRQLLRVRLVEILQEWERIYHPEHSAGRDARLETALAAFSHLLHLKAGRLVTSRKVVHRLKLPHDALEPLLLVGRWAASPLAALDLNVNTDGRAWLRELRQQLRSELRLRRRPLGFPHWFARVVRPHDFSHDLINCNDVIN